MKRRFSSAILIYAALGTLPATLSVAQEPYRAASIYMLPPREVAEPVRKVLDPTGAYLAGADGKPVAEMWLRRNVPLRANASGAGYGALAEGTLVGVLNFPQDGADFRGQPIPAGAYTLRYEHIPEDGNHLGAAPESDFLLLCPAAADPELDASFNFDSLVELSRKASGTNHPVPLMLIATPATGEFPGIQRNDMGHVALRLKTSAKRSGSDTPQEFPVALVLVGRAEL